VDLPEPDRAGFVEVNRTRLRVWEWGAEDAPPVVCVHGAYDHGRMWDGLAPRLAELGLRVVAPDLRGHGDSGRLSSGHAWMAMALDLALLARALGPPVGLVGHSFGGGQALFVAGVWPELVRWVVNLDGLGPPPAAFDDDADLVAMATKGLDMARRIRSGPPRVYPSREDMARRRGKVNVRLPAEWLDHLVRHGSVACEGGFAWKFDPTFGSGLPASFSIAHLQAEHEAVRCPVLVLTGTEHDTWSDLDDGQIAERVGWIGARHEVVPGAGHYLHVEAPEPVMAAVSGFLAEVEA
jgi:pimeloyl-ACP methyl ester carboxylesterase